MCSKYRRSTVMTTDAAGTSLGDSLHSSFVKYRYDIGANVEATSPAPAGNALGKKTTRLFDAVGRLQKETIVNSGAYTRYEYPTNGVQSKVFSTIIDTNGNGADALDEVMSESWSDGAGRVRRSRTPHTFDASGNPLTWAGTIAEYDILGRVSRSSVPTEVSVPDPNNPDTWTPAGDDQSRGFLWTYQKYDWKNRVVRKINTDGADSPVLNDSDVLVSYDGCGCAGGQVTTIQSERVPIPGTLNFGRRAEKSYEDILGRTYSAETLNWDGSIYTTTVNKFNGRDQSVSIKQYEGTQGSSTFQELTTSYDGFGRKVTEHLPIMDVGTIKSYQYQAEDQLIAQWDARGVKTDYQFDSLGRLQTISQVAPSNSTLPASPVITFGYDNLGNRLWMQDGMGRMDYEYDELTRLKAETRTFSAALTDAPQSANGFRMSYSYHLGGDLKNVTYPNGNVVNYNLDKTGSSESITGTVDGQAKTFLSNADYRAWGATKKVSFGNGTNWEMAYNNRLLPDSEKFFGVASATNAVLDNRLTYYPDGNLKLIDNKAVINAYEMGFDSKLVKYDHAGRIVSERSGDEALGTATSANFIKYSYDFTYDVFGNKKTDFTRTGFHPGDNPGGTKHYNYVNNRLMGGTVTLPDGSLLGNVLAVQYDADGRPVANQSAGSLASTYNTAGYLTRRTSGADNSQDYWQDGSGNLLKVIDFNRTEGETSTIITTIVRYSLWSSVIGEAMLFETNTRGSIIRKNTQTYIYGLGDRIAVTNEKTELSTPNDVWKFTDFEFDTAFRQNSVKSQFETSNPSTAGNNGTARIDYLSTQGLEMSSINPGSAGRSAGVRWDTTGFNFFSGGECTLDGVYIGCESVGHLMGFEGNGGAVQCPNNDCGPRTATYIDPFGRGHDFLTGGFEAHADGSSGFGIPSGILKMRDNYGAIFGKLDNEYAMLGSGGGGGKSGEGEPCTLPQPDGTKIQGTTDEHGGCNPSIGNFDAGTSYGSGFNLAWDGGGQRVDWRSYTVSTRYGKYYDYGRLVTDHSNRYTEPLRIGGFVNSVCSTALNPPIRPNTYWRGPDGRFFKGPFSAAKALSVVKYGTFGIGTAISGAQMINGDVSPLQGTTDIAFGAIGAFGGPKGWVVSGGYFLYQNLPPPAYGNPGARTVSTNTCHGGQDHNPSSLLVR
ncbi:MAG: hypothetical protein HOP17_16075 [Acidobacteria bacterium]|nr:hypothetical protein [Acidobacteriota bacterium]